MGNGHGQAWRYVCMYRASPPPPLENVILTRWPAAHVDWNGNEVLL